MINYYDTYNGTLLGDGTTTPVQAFVWVNGQLVPVIMAFTPDPEGKLLYNRGGYGRGTYPAPASSNGTTTNTSA